MDPRTGEILALVSSPSFNPNLFVTGINHKDYSSYVTTSINLFITVLFKGFILLVQPLNQWKRWVVTLWYCRLVNCHFRPWLFPFTGDSHKFRDWKKTGHGIVNMHKAIIMSCDTYFYILSIKWALTNEPMDAPIWLW
jgi:penicillin-binding protein 2